MSYKRKLAVREVIVEPETAVGLRSFVEELAVSSNDREVILDETREFMKARLMTGMGILGMGEHLERLRGILDPLGMWKRYLSLLPNLTQATAYRAIWAWENARRALPPATLTVAVKEGYKLISAKKDEDFTPAYKPAVEAVVKEAGPAPEKDEGKAKEWLKAVLMKKKEMSKVGRVTREITFEEMENRLLAAFVRTLKSVEPANRRAVAERLIGIMLGAAGVPKAKLRVMPAPTEIREALAS